MNFLTLYHYTTNINAEKILKEGFAPKSRIIPYNASKIPFYPKNKKAVFFSFDNNIHGHLQGLLEHIVSKTLNPNIALIELNIPYNSYLFYQLLVLDFKPVLEANNNIVLLREKLFYTTFFSLNFIKEYFRFKKHSKILKTNAFLEYWNSRTILEKYLLSKKSFSHPEIISVEKVSSNFIVNIKNFDFREYFPESSLVRYLR